MAEDERLAERVMNWAEGRILTRACDGRLLGTVADCFADVAQTAVDPKARMATPDWEALIEARRGVPEHEERLLALATSFGAGEEISLFRHCSDLGPADGAIVAEAVTYALGLTVPCGGVEVAY